MKHLLSMAVCAAMILLSACAASVEKSTTESVSPVSPPSVGSSVAEASAPSAALAPSEGFLGAFETTDFSDAAVTPAYFAKNKLTLVNLWTTWCGYCVEELPTLEKLSKTYAPQGVAVVGVLGDGIAVNASGELAPDEEALSAAKKLMESAGVTYPMWKPDRMLYSTLVAQAPGFPTTLFVDANGVLVGKMISGAKSYENWCAEIDARLASLLHA